MKMSKQRSVLAGAVAVGVAAGTASAAPITAGDLVVYRVGDGTQTLVNTGNSVFLDEYTPAGTLVQSIAAPTVLNGTNAPLIASGTATSEGLISISADGRYIGLTGYDATLGGTTSLTGSSSATVNRTIGVFTVATGGLDTSTALTDLSTGNNPRSAYTDGTNIYATGGAGGIRYTTIGSTASTQLSTTTTNLRQVNVFGGQLYVTSGSGATRVASVGTGTPTTSGQTITNLPGISSTNSTSPYSFYFADLSPTVAGLDTLYVADDTTSGGVIEKFSLVGGTWTATGTVTATGVRGLSGTVGTTGGVSLFASTGASAATGGGSLYSFLDTTGYDGTVSGIAQTIATATANEAFRGVAATPGATFVAVPEPTTVGVAVVGAAGLVARRRRRA